MARDQDQRDSAGPFARFGLGGFIAFAIEGVVAVIISLYMIFSPSSARDNIRLVAGLLLILAGVYQILRGFHFHRANTHRGVTPLRFVAGGVMLFGGVLVAIEELTGTGHVNDDASRSILAASLLVAGGFGILAAVLGLKDGDFKIANVLASVVLIVLAGFNIVEVRSNKDETRTLAYIVLALGILLLAYGYFLRQRDIDAEPDAPPPAPVARYTAPPPAVSFPASTSEPDSNAAAAFERSTEPIAPAGSEPNETPAS